MASINTLKEQSTHPKPLLVAEITFSDGTNLYLSTDSLNVSDGGATYDGKSYLPRIIREDIAATQAVSDTGFSMPSSVSLTLADPDGLLWTTYEKPKGFRGAILTLRMIFWEVGTGTFSDNSLIRFIGTCSTPRYGSTDLVLQAHSRLNLARTNLPSLTLQQTCPWNFPATTAHQDAANDEDSPHYECGYGPARVSDPKGNGAFTSCALTKTACIARGMYSTDSAARDTGRFGGVDWKNPDAWQGRAYKSKFEDGANVSPDITGQAVPLVYGTAWVDGIVLSVDGDANSTRFQVMVCYGQIHQVYRVVVNDKEVPPGHRLNSSTRAITNFNARDELFVWRYTNPGDRNGTSVAERTETLGFDGDEDPYGSMCVIHVVVPRALVNSSSAPRVKVLVDGPQIRKYTDVSTFAKTSSPENRIHPWILMDVLIWSGWKYDMLDIQSFIDAAAIASVSISYQDNFGSTVNHPRYRGSMVLREATSSSQIINGLLNAMKAILSYDETTGKFKLVIKQTLADQQGSPVAGSNYDTAIASKAADGTATNGYVAYHFDESTIALKSGGQGQRNETSLMIEPKPNTDTPNRVTVQLQDEDFQHALTTVSITDTDAITRLDGHEINGSIALKGIGNIDQAKRVVGTYLAESYRGNTRNSPYGDSGGSWIYSWETSVRGVHLNAGDIVALSSTKWGIDKQLVRIIQIKPSENYQRMAITAIHHSDEWYLDSWGQLGPAKFSDQTRNRLDRPPLPMWISRRQDSYIDALYPDEKARLTFSSSPSASPNVSGLIFENSLPVNTFTSVIQRPAVPVQGNTASIGGNLVGGKFYWMALVAEDSDGKLTPPTSLVQVWVPAGTSTNQISIPDVAWDDATVAYLKFMGDDTERLYYYGRVAATPASVAFTEDPNASTTDQPIPDTEIKTLRFRFRYGVHLGVWASEITGVTSSTITLTNAYWTTNEWAGRVVSLLGSLTDNVDVSGSQPSWLVVSNTTDTLTLDAGYGPDPTTVIPFGGGANRSLLLMRTKADTHTATTIGDEGFDNSLNLFTAQTISGASNATPIVITTSDVHSYTTGQRVRIDSVLGNTAANGVWTITVASTTTFSLNTSVGNGSYAGSGTARRLTGGLQDGVEKGLIVRIIAGTGKGQTRRIAGNTGNVLRVETPFAVVPDNTSVFVVESPVEEKTIDIDPGDVTEFDNGHTPTVDLTGLTQKALVCYPTALDGVSDETPLASVIPVELYFFNSMTTIETIVVQGLP